MSERPFTRCLTAWIAGIALVSCAAAPSVAQDPGGNTAPDVSTEGLSAHRSACERLLSTNFESAADRPFVIQSASFNEEAVTPEGARSQLHKRAMSQGMHDYIDTLPAHCEIRGYIAPAIQFVAMLPTADAWDSKTLYGACDALCGDAQWDMAITGMTRGFATIATDGGHVNRRPFDGVWGYMNDQAQIDFGYEASHLAAQTISALSSVMYGTAPELSFIAGFSKGGAAGIKAALTYPEDFDGVLARAPVVNYQAINAVRMPYIYKAVQREDGTPILTAANVPLIHSTVVEVCDPADGLVDGIIDDPRACDFDPAVMLCESGMSENCLTEEQVEALRKVYTEPTGSDGSVVYPNPVELGSELDWPKFLVPLFPGDESFAESIGRTYIRYLAFPEDPGADYDWLSFDPVTEGDRLDALASVYDANDPDLSAFRDAGGKMIVMHGWGDGAVSARTSIDWYENVQAEMGDTDDFIRFFLIPGNKHGHGGDGPELNEALAALEAWVNEGAAPEMLLLTQEDEDGQLLRTRPVYPYPLTAKYVGTGSIDEAENFQPSE